MRRHLHTSQKIRNVESLDFPDQLEISKTIMTNHEHNMTFQVKNNKNQTFHQYGSIVCDYGNRDPYNQDFLVDCSQNNILAIHNPKQKNIIFDEVQLNLKYKKFLEFKRKGIIQWDQNISQIQWVNSDPKSSKNEVQLNKLAIISKYAVSIIQIEDYQKGEYSKEFGYRTNMCKIENVYFSKSMDHMCILSKEEKNQCCSKITIVNYLKKKKIHSEIFQKNIKSCTFENENLVILYEGGEIEGIMLYSASSSSNKNNDKQEGFQRKNLNNMRSYIGDITQWGFDGRCFASVTESNDIKIWSAYENKIQELEVENCIISDTVQEKENIFNNNSNKNGKKSATHYSKKSKLCQQMIRKQVNFIKVGGQKQDGSRHMYQKNQSEYLFVGNSKDRVGNITLYKLKYGKKMGKKGYLSSCDIVEKFTVNYNESLPVLKLFSISDEKGCFLLCFHKASEHGDEPRKYAYFSGIYVNMTNLESDSEIQQVQISQDSFDYGFSNFIKNNKNNNNSSGKIQTPNNKIVELFDDGDDQYQEEEGEKNPDNNDNSINNINIEKEQNEIQIQNYYCDENNILPCKRQKSANKQNNDHNKEDNSDSELAIIKKLNFNDQQEIDLIKRQNQKAQIANNNIFNQFGNTTLMNNLTISKVVGMQHPNRKVQNHPSPQKKLTSSNLIKNISHINPLNVSKNTTQIQNIRLEKFTTVIKNRSGYTMRPLFQNKFYYNQNLKQNCYKQRIPLPSASKFSDDISEDNNIKDIDIFKKNYNQNQSENEDFVQPRSKNITQQEKEQIQQYVVDEEEEKSQDIQPASNISSLVCRETLNSRKSSINSINTGSFGKQKSQPVLLKKAIQKQPQQQQQQQQNVKKSLFRTRKSSNMVLNNSMNQSVIGKSIADKIGNGKKGQQHIDEVQGQGMNQNMEMIDFLKAKNFEIISSSSSSPKIVDQEQDHQQNEENNQIQELNLEKQTENQQKCDNVFQQNDEVIEQQNKETVTKENNIEVEEENQSQNQEDQGSNDGSVRSGDSREQQSTQKLGKKFKSEAKKNDSYQKQKQKQNQNQKQDAKEKEKQLIEEVSGGQQVIDNLINEMQAIIQKSTGKSSEKQNQEKISQNSQHISQNLIDKFNKEKQNNNNSDEGNVKEQIEKEDIQNNQQLYNNTEEEEEKFDQQKQNKYHNDESEQISQFFNKEVFQTQKSLKKQQEVSQQKEKSQQENEQDLSSEKLEKMLPQSERGKFIRKSKSSSQKASSEKSQKEQQIQNEKQQQEEKEQSSNIENLLDNLENLFGSSQQQQQPNKNQEQNGHISQKQKEQQLFNVDISKISQKSSFVLDRDRDRDCNKVEKRTPGFFCSSQPDMFQSQSKGKEVLKSQIDKFSKSSPNILLQKRKLQDLEENLHEKSQKKLCFDRDQYQFLEKNKEKLKEYLDVQQLREKIHCMKKLNIFYLTESLSHQDFQFSFKETFQQLSPGKTHQNQNSNNNIDQSMNSDQKIVVLECKKKQNLNEIHYRFGFKNDLCYFEGNHEFHVFIDSQNLIYIIDAKSGQTIMENPQFQGKIVFFDINFNSDLILLSEDCQLKILNLKSQEIVYNQNIQQLVELAYKENLKIEQKQQENVSGILKDNLLEQNQDFVFENSQKQDYILEKIAKVNNKTIVFFKPFQAFVYNKIFDFWEAIQKDMSEMLWLIIQGKDFSDEEFFKNFKASDKSLIQYDDILELLIEKYNFMFFASFASRMVLNWQNQQDYQSLRNFVGQFIDRENILCRFSVKNQCQILSLINALLTQREEDEICGEILQELELQFQIQEEIFE